MKFFSNFLSVIFHPITMVTYAATIYFFLLPSGFVVENTEVTWRILGLLSSSTILIPALSLFLLWKSGSIRSIRIEDQKERNWPLLLGALIYFGAFYVMQNKAVPVFIQLFLLGAILGILISLVINLKWKISLHMIGIGGLCGGLVAIMLLLQTGNPLLLAGVFFLAGLLGTARLYLNAHSPAQIFAGFLTGFSVQFILMLVMGVSFGF